MITTHLKKSNIIFLRRWKTTNINILDHTCDKKIANKNHTTPRKIYFQTEFCPKLNIKPDIQHKISHPIRKNY